MPLRFPHVEVAEGLELFSKNKGWASLLSAFALLLPSRQKLEDGGDEGELLGSSGSGVPLGQWVGVGSGG